MWSLNGHATCYELQKGTFYHNDTQRCARFNRQSAIYYICTDGGLNQNCYQVTGEAKLKTRATRQELIFEREESGRGTNRHFLM